MGLDSEHKFKQLSMGGGSSTVAPGDQLDTSVVVPRTSSRKSRRNESFCGCFSLEKRRYSFEDNERRTLREEAKSWSNNFEKMLKHSIGQKAFQEFLQGQFSDENLRFWVEAEIYRNMTDLERQKRAKSLYDDFVSTISPCEVSLNAQHRQQIEKNIQDAPKNLFRPAQEYIYSLMYRDCFPRYLKSKTYRRLCR